jgi:REP element-mobilizing transposase RayT
MVGENDQWERTEAERRLFAPVFLSDAQRRFVDKQLPELCERGGWDLHWAAVQPDHVHVLLSSTREDKAVRRWLKQ